MTPPRIEVDPLVLTAESTVSYNLRADRRLSHIRGSLERGTLPLSKLAVWLWIEIQGRIATRTPLELVGSMISWPGSRAPPYRADDSPERQGQPGSEIQRTREQQRRRCAEQQLGGRGR